MKPTPVPVPDLLAALREHCKRHTIWSCVLLFGDGSGELRPSPECKAEEAAYFGNIDELMRLLHS